MNIKMMRILLVMFFTMFVNNAQSASVFLDTTNVSFNAGDNFDINVFANGVTDLAGFEFSLGFNNTLLSGDVFTSADIFFPLGFPIVFSSPIDNAIGTVHYGETTFGAGVDFINQTLLATINFTALLGGTDVLDLNSIVLSDSQGNGITVNVPEPSSLFLLLMGSLLISFKYKKIVIA